MKKQIAIWMLMGVLLIEVTGQIVNPQLVRADWIYKIDTKISYTNDNKFNMSYIDIDPWEMNKINPNVVNNRFDENNQLVDCYEVDYKRLIPPMLTELQYLRSELCKKDPTYGFCETPTTADKVIDDKNQNIVFSKDYLDKVSKTTTTIKVTTTTLKT